MRRYDGPLCHLIYAASDLFLVPSMFEPCGLTQVRGTEVWEVWKSVRGVGGVGS